MKQFKSIVLVLTVLGIAVPTLVLEGSERAKRQRLQKILQLDKFNSALLDSKGRVVAAGQDREDALIERFNVNETHDMTFGTNGSTEIDLGGLDTILILALDSLGRIVAGGRGGPGGDALIMRFTPEGGLDTSFGGSGTGFNLIDFGGGSDGVVSLNFDEKGNIIAKGWGGVDQKEWDIKLSPDGIIEKIEQVT